MCKNQGKVIVTVDPFFYFIVLNTVDQCVYIVKMQYSIVSWTDCTEATSWRHTFRASEYRLFNAEVPSLIWLGSDLRNENKLPKNLDCQVNTLLVW